MMFAELVKLQTPEGFNRDKAIEDVRTTAGPWQENGDLLRKHFLFGEDGCCYGFYVWKSKEAAKLAHNEEWQSKVVQRMGNRAEIFDFDIMAILDNEQGTLDEYPPDAGFHANAEAAE